MRTKEQVLSVTATSPAAASTVVVSPVFSGGVIKRADYLIVDALLTGGTGGALDVYLQRKTGTNAWLDWIHFPQVAAGTSKKYTVVLSQQNTTIADVGGGTDASPGVSLAANSFVNMIPTDDVRIVFVAGGGTSAGASNTVTITPVTQRM
jgi:hypothetical protein